MPTAFTVTYVNGDFWLVDEDPTNGDQPGWAVAHEATTPSGFNNDLLDAVTLFDPGQTTFSGIDDSPPGLIHYAVGMLDPAAVGGGVVIEYNVNDGDVDQGCVSLLNYDANAYRPRFVDVPAGDLTTVLNGASSALSQPAGTTASPGTAPGSAGKPAAAGAGAPTVSFSPHVAALGAARLKAVPQAAASTTWTYNPDAVPSGATWGSSCPVSYSAVDPHIAINQLADGSVEVSWPNQGPDVWYWFHWQDDTSYPGTWNENEFWTEGPNADGYLIPPPAGALASTSSTVFQIFTLPAETVPGDQFSFWVQAFAAGNGQVISPDTSASAVSYAPISPTEGVTGLTATPGVGSVALTWTAPPAPVAGQAVWYSVRYKMTSQSTWSYTTDYITNTADMTPLIGGQKYEFEVAVTDLETEITTTNAFWSAPVDATTQT